jgi:carbonic anhydrase/acetyltransferase-like protein (isoleucine patch superfamily)
MGAKLLGHSRIGKGCVIGAGAVVAPGLQVPDGMVVVGVPGRIVREVNVADRAFLAGNPPH